MSSPLGPLVVERARTLIATATEALATLVGGLACCPSGELEDVAAEIARVRLAAENALVEVAREAIERGRPFDTGAASPGAWVEQAAGTSMSGTDARQVGAVAAAITAPSNAPVREALARGAFGVRIAACVLRQNHEFQTSLPWGMSDEMLAPLCTLAESGFDVRELRDWRREMIATYGREGLLDTQQQALAAKRAMSRFVEHEDGMWHAEVRLDPVSYAQVAPALDALSAPSPTAEDDGAVIRDARSAEQRRADAFVELCTVYPGLTGAGVRSTPKTKLIVTMAYRDLVDGIGVGTTTAGQVLSPSAVREVACDAGIIPMVLGGPSVPIDVGREERLATPAQVTALRQRDKGCTFPGCGRPPTWCKAHHIRHWSRLGRTDMSNLALLCQHHHSHVHRHDLTATVDDSGVHWHVHPGALGARAA